MEKEACYYLGKITRTNGNKGGVSVFLDTDNPQEYSNLDAIFVEIKKQLIPYFIEKINIHTSKNTALVYFEDINDVGSAAALNNCALYLPLASLPILDGNKFYFHEVVDFLLIEEKFGELGRIKQVLEYPNQALFQTFYKEKEVLVPINDMFIKNVDREKKEILLSLPDGLLDVYIEG
ncbi:MAG: ribosome maturation factor RimM [Bacteroidales bacterium]|jgi:16S rRNA processing protein RimM|nr:ribosome maturation factor RimM [Bacteroidales bacterium]